MQKKGIRDADAMAWYVTALLQEESSGPEKALESKKKVLELDPGFGDLAIELSSEFLRRGETAEATAVLKDAIVAAPRQIPPYLALATIYLKHLGKPELAVKYGLQALDKSPESIEPYEILWETYQDQHQFTKAAQILEKAAKVKSNDPEFWIALAEINTRTLGTNVPTAALAEKVEQFLVRAAELAPENVDVQSRVGDMFIISQQPEKAPSYYVKVLEKRPLFPHAREKLATCYIKSGQTEKAIPQVEELVKMNSLNLSAYEQLTQLYLRVGKPAQALINAKQALLIDPTAVERHMLVVELLSRMKRYGEMAQALGEARQQFPALMRLTQLQAVALSQAKRHKEAMETFERLVKEASNSPSDVLNADFYFDYGSVAEQAGHYAKAAELFKKCMELDPQNSGRAANYLGYMWVDRGEHLEEAEQLIRSAIALEPQNGAYQDSLGWLLYKQGKYPEALAELLRATEMMGQPDPTVFAHLGDTYQKLGKMAEAVLYWRKAVSIDPANAELMAKLDKAAEKVAQQPTKDKRKE